MKRRSAQIGLILLSSIGFADAVLLFAQPTWFPIFVGLMIPIVLPFAGAMICMMAWKEVLRVN